MPKDGYLICFSKKNPKERKKQTNKKKPTKKPQTKQNKKLKKKQQTNKNPQNFQLILI